MEQNIISMIKDEKHVCNFEKLTYTIPEVSELLNISVSQAYKLANQNAFPTIRLGKRILVSIKKLEEFINQ
jgi:excisionase family DNA binding protein